MQTRGDQIKKTRLARPMTQLELANATGVGMRTIGRIEAGKAETSRSVEVLEAYLRAGDNATTQFRRDDGPSLKEATLMQLCAELTTRIAALEARDRDR